MKVTKVMKKELSRIPDMKGALIVLVSVWEPYSSKNQVQDRSLADIPHLTSLRLSILLNPQKMDSQYLLRLLSFMVSNFRPCSDIRSSQKMLAGEQKAQQQLELQYCSSLEYWTNFLAAKVVATKSCSFLRQPPLPLGEKLTFVQLFCL